MSGLSQYIVYLLPVAALALIFYFFLYYWQAQQALPAGDPLSWVRQYQERESRPFSLAGRCHPMGKKDALPLLLITAIYALTAFAHLGSLSAPQSAQSFSQTSTVVFELDQAITLSGVGWYTGLGTGEYSLEVSADGEHWQALQIVDEVSEDNGVTWYPKGSGQDTQELQTREAYYWTDVAEGASPGSVRSIRQSYNTLFKWRQIHIQDSRTVQAKYLRLTGFPGKPPLELGELALYDETGALIPVDLSSSPLFDEQDTVPEHSTYYDSAYFDEIYHPRTALEHIRNIKPYEISHPPLGKLIMSVGIRMFGMTPFGWRFMGTLFGVAMLPLLYVFLKNLFGKTLVASCGTILFAADFMHLTQTRIGTIDTYGVFFILLMYYFMYRYLALPAGSSFGKCALPLFFSGLFWGIGAASKWTVVYGCVGLVVLYFLGLWMKLRDWPREQRQVCRAWTVKILLFSVLCFALIPAVIYTLSYWPYSQANGDTSLRGLIDVMLDNQKYMFTYHKGVTDSHPYSSRWYQWILNIRPILYYLDTSVPGMKTAFGAFSNPVVCWAGLLAVVSAAVQMVRRRCGQALFIVIGYLSQLVPWMFIGRITFEYHYFPSILFLTIALAYVFNDLAELRPPRWKGAVYGVTGGAVALYALFYPVLVGVTVPTWYSAVFLRWMPSWPF